MIFELQQNLWRGHPHNIILELGISYGYPVVILFFSSIITLLILSSKLVFNKKNQPNELNSFERAWWTSIFTFCFSQLFDIQNAKRMIREAQKDKDELVEDVYWDRLDVANRLADECKAKIQQIFNDTFGA